MNRPPLRVLVVDDDPFFVTAIGALFEPVEEIEVVGCASNGRDAVEKALLLRPDLVTMDIDMPLMDGVEATRELVKRIPDTRVLLVSGSQHAERAETARDAGACGYITKSLAPEQLTEAVLALARGDGFVLAL